MRESGSIDFARSYAEDLIAKAKNRIEGVVEPSPSLDILISMADWFIDRLKQASVFCCINNRQIVYVGVQQGNGHYSKT